jgi:hypothetical protein
MMAHPLGPVPNDFPPNGDEWIERRSRQVAADPAWESWFLRARVLRGEQLMVSFTSRALNGERAYDHYDAGAVPRGRHRSLCFGLFLATS